MRIRHNNFKWLHYASVLPVLLIPVIGDMLGLEVAQVLPAMSPPINVFQTVKHKDGGILLMVVRTIQGLYEWPRTLLGIASRP